MDNSIIVSALDIIQDGLLIIDKDFVIEYANEPAKKLLRTDELVGKHTYETIWRDKDFKNKSPEFICFDMGRVSDAEKTFGDGTCLHIQAYPFSVDRAVITIWDITDYVNLERKLEESTGNDVITGLKSSDSFINDIEKELERAKRTSSEMSLIFIDLGLIEGEDDVEKYENLLEKMANVIVETARSYDIGYRLYGDTFALIMPHCSVENAKGTADRIIKKSHEIGGGFTPSVGISSSKNAFTGRDIIRLAERALYVAKHRGGNTFVAG